MTMIAKMKSSVCLVFAVLIGISTIRTQAFVGVTRFGIQRRHMDGTTAFGQQHEIDFQSDNEKYGRGDFHLSAALEEGDLVVYQTGTWFLEGVELGDGSPIAFRYGVVENMQVVWTHNCEHGVIRCVEAVVDDTARDTGAAVFSINDPPIDVEFGPEQLVARVPVEWDTEQRTGIALAPFDDDNYTTWLSNSAPSWDTTDSIAD